MKHTNKYDNFSLFIIGKALDTAISLDDITDEEKRTAYSLAVGTGITPKKIYNETYQLFADFLKNHNNTDLRLLGILYEIASLAEYDEFYTRASDDAAIDYYKNNPDCPEIQLLKRYL